MIPPPSGQVHDLTCSRCGTAFEWTAPLGGGNPPTYCSDRCRNRAAKTRRQARTGPKPTPEPDPTDVIIAEMALAAIRTAPDDDTAREHYQIARQHGADIYQLRDAWKHRYGRDNYRQPHQPTEVRVIRCATGKWRYPSQDAARRTLNTLLHVRAVRDLSERMEQRSYHCDRCDGWHLTSQPQWSEMR